MANPRLVIGVVPAFRNVRERFAVLPTLTVPNVNVFGVICNSGCAPVPDSATPRGSGAAELAIEREPVRAPLCDGANVTCSAQLAPAANVPPGWGHVPAATE
jgi:hypothetical protein